MKLDKSKPSQRTRSGILAIISLLLFSLSLFFSNKQAPVAISEREFEKMMLNKDVQKVVYIINKKVVEITLKPEALTKEPYKTELEKQIYFVFTTIQRAPHYSFLMPSFEIFDTHFRQLETRLGPASQLGYTSEEHYDVIRFIVDWGLLLILLATLWLMMSRTPGGFGPGNQIFNFGKSRAALFDAESDIKVTFNDVAGLQEAKEEIKEIVAFLKNPDKFTKLGGKIPKGALLIGPPGTGKTLLAKAVAGEAGVPFFSLSGSDFVELFVGVGAARVRDLFERAKAKAPAIIFIDEIDAIGRSRGREQLSGANDERENTLNSLLVEMDGFGTDSGVIILAATNRPRVLDQALLRPGRFDRQISLDKPDIIDREAILKVHLKPLQLAQSIDTEKLAAQTPGFAGAELGNICNEAALIAARRDKVQIGMEDFQDAIDREIGGLEKKNKIISPQEKRIVAYHEAGHAVSGWFLEHADPLVKVSVVPRGVAALGYAQYLPKEQFLYQTEQLFDTLCMALGGRIAEEITFGKVSTGALNDLERVTKVAYSMVTVYGMNRKIGPISFHDPEQPEYSFTKPYSEHTARTIDEEVRNIVDKAYKRTQELLLARKEELETVATTLLQKEIIFQQDLEQLIGPRPYPNPEASVSKKMTIAEKDGE